MTLLKIANGTIYDPANNIDRQVMDRWVRDGKIVAALAPVAHAPGAPRSARARLSRCA
jgi:formylmethanofuran dehydrogenase subunit A